MGWSILFIEKKIEKPRQLPFSIPKATAGNVYYDLLSWVVSQVDRLGPRETKSVSRLQHIKMSLQSNKSSLRQFFLERILTSLKAAHSALTFSVVNISRWSQAGLNEYWSLSDRGTNRHHLQLRIWSLYINYSFNHELLHWGCMKNFVIIQNWRSLYKAFIYWLTLFIRSFAFLFGHKINILLTEREVCMGESWRRYLVQTSPRSICTGRDLGQDSPTQTSCSVNKNWFSQDRPANVFTIPRHDYIARPLRCKGPILSPLELNHTTRRGEASQRGEIKIL